MKLAPYGLFIVERAIDGSPVFQWLKRYDPDWNEGRGAIETTADPKQAMTFPNALAALDEWKRASTELPLRLDGKPNRPLSAYTASPAPLDRPPYPIRS